MIISIINQKGGVGKSSTVHNLGAGLAARGLRVLLIDLDSQSNLSYSLDAIGKTPNAFSVLAESAEAGKAITEAGVLSLIPGSSFLAAADKFLTQTGAEYRLKESLAGVSGGFDFILIDTPPALGILTINALTASDAILIPAQADIFSVQGIAQLWESVDAVKKYTNRGLSVLGILLTRFTPRTALARGMVKALREMAARQNAEVFQASIRECVAVKEAQTLKKDIFAYAKRSNAAMDYLELVDEFLKKTREVRK